MDTVGGVVGEERSLPEVNTSKSSQTCFEGRQSRTNCGSSVSPTFFTGRNRRGALTMGTEGLDVLHTFDFGSIEEMDPSIGEAYSGCMGVLDSYDVQSCEKTYTTRTTVSQFVMILR